MKDKLQSIAIIFLLFSSVILFFLNFGIDFRNFRFRNENKTSNVIFSSQALMEDAVMPEYIAINFGGDYHTVFNNPKDKEFWPESSKLFNQIFEEDGKKILSIDDVNEDVYKQLLFQKSIYMVFNKDITTLTLLNSLGVEESKKLLSDFGNIESLYISLEKPFIIMSQESKISLITFDNLDTSTLNTKVSNLFLEGFNKYSLSEVMFENGRIGYIPIISEHKIKKVRFYNLLSTVEEENIENIVFNFFGKELNYIREIKEDGVQTIYIDGEKIMKISQRGLISYFNPEELIDTERNLYVSLETALSYISKNLGYDDSLYLKEIRPIEVTGIQGFKMIFGKNSKGYKVIIDPDKEGNIVDFIEIDVFNENIRRFSQYFRGEIPGGGNAEKSYINIGPNQEIRPIIAKNIDQINQNLKLASPLSFEEILGEIKSADLVYVDKGDLRDLGLAWKVNIKDQEFIFNIETQ